MKIGVPKERKPDEQRVALTPYGVKELVARGHAVWVETGAGEGSGFSDAAYRKEGAKVFSTPEQVFEADLILKVKEPQPIEWPFLREGQILFTFLHLAAQPKLVDALLKKKVVAIGYETITDSEGGLPLLFPMSQLAGRLATDVGAEFLQAGKGGKGTYLGHSPGVPPAKVAVIGGGVVGSEAARAAAARGADVTLFEKDYQKLTHLDALYSSQMKILYPYADQVEAAVEQADLVVGAVLTTGRRAPIVVEKATVQKMEPGSLIVDVAIDQGGCIETTEPTTLRRPIRTAHGILHYAVSNMPSLVPRTATKALSTALFPYLLALADKGWERLQHEDPHFSRGINLCLGKVTHPSIAEDLDFPYTVLKSSKRSSE